MADDTDQSPPIEIIPEDANTPVGDQTDTSGPAISFTVAPGQETQPAPETEIPTTSTPTLLQGGASQPVVFDQMAQARGSGYSWGAIDGHLAQSRTAAAGLGYSDSDVDAFLGFNPGPDAANRFQTSWQTALAQDPTLADDVAKPTAADQPAPFDLSHPNVADDYSRALLDGSVKGPSDFTAQYADAFTKALDVQPTPALQANVAKAANALAAQLPDIKQLTDVALGLTVDMMGGVPQPNAGSENSNFTPAQVLAKNQAYAKPGPYITHLTLEDETKFQAWAKKNDMRADAPDNETSDYDMRGFWKAQMAGEPEAKASIDPNDHTMHEPDKWKTPYDLTFSKESQFATEGAPEWNEKDQLVLPNGNIVYDDRNREPYIGTAPRNAVSVLSDVRKNLMKRWADTGDTPMQTYQKAQADPALAETMTAPPKVPTVPTMSDMLKSYSLVPSTHAPMPEVGLASTIGSAVEKFLSGMSPQAYMQEEARILGGGQQRYDIATGRQLKPEEETDAETTLAPGEKFTAGNGQVVTNATEPVGRGELANFVAGHILGTVSPRPEGALGAGIGGGVGQAADSALGGGTRTVNPEVASAVSERIFGAKTAPTILRQGLDKLWGINPEHRQMVQGTLIENQGVAERALAVLAESMVKFRKLAEDGLDEQRQYIQDRHAYAKMVGADKEAWVKSGGDPAAFSPEDPGVAPPARPWQQQLVDHIEGLPTDHPDLQPGSNSELMHFATALKDGYGMLKDDMIATKPDMEHFKEHYLAHSYTRPEAFNEAFGSGRTGSGAAYQERTVPTINDALNAGLTPLHINQVDNILHAANGILKFNAISKSFKAGYDAGYIKYGTTAPEKGWLPINGPGTVKSTVTGGPVQRAYAPPGFARSWNSNVSNGFSDWKAAGINIGEPIAKFLNVQQRLNNTSLSMLFALSGYHWLNIAKAAQASAISSQLGMLRGASGMVTNFLDPALAYIGQGAGKSLRHFYLHPEDTSNPAMARLADIAARSGLRLGGRGREYLHSSVNASLGVGSRNLWQAFKEHTKLSPDVERGVSDESVMAKAIMTPLRAGEFVAHQITGVSDMLGSPLFDTIVPTLKGAVWHDEMEGFLRRNPGATDEQLVTYGRTVRASVDGRAGELNQDTLFWPREVKQVLNAFGVSVSWAYGTLRNLGTGLRDTATGRVLSVNSRFLTGYMMATAMNSMLYARLRTGMNPQGWKQYVTPPTGGKTSDLKEPELALNPGEEKEPMEIANDFMAGNPFNYLLRKAGVVTRVEADLVANAGDLLRLSHEAWGKIGTDVANNLPISLRQQTLKGSALGPGWHALGARAAPFYWQEPAEFAAAQAKAQAKAAAQAAGLQRWQNSRLATPDASIESPEKHAAEARAAGIEKAKEKRAAETPEQRQQIEEKSQATRRAAEAVKSPEQRQEERRARTRRRREDEE